MHRAEPHPDLPSACQYVFVSGRLAYTAAWVTWTKERVIDTRTKVTGLPRRGICECYWPLGRPESGQAWMEEEMLGRLGCES